MVNEIKIGDCTIGPDSSAYVIAEAGVNHNGSMQIAKQLIDIAVEANADAVKFQKRNLTQTYLEDIVQDPAIAEMGVEYTVSNLKDVLLTDTQYRELAQYSEEQGIQFLCSPWDTDSVDFLEDVGIPAFKVGSPDMTNFVLLERLLETGKPLLLSTGMSEEKEIDRTVEFLRERDADFGLLHCRSTYPSPFHNLNLNFMNELRDRYNVPIGYSGHERGIAVSSGAVAMGASIIERHFTLSRDMEGPDHSASLEPQGLEKLIRDIRNTEESKGTSRRYLTRGEYNNRVSLAKSLATTRKIREGEKISREDLTAKSPARGISPQELYNIVGKQAQQDLGADEILQWDVIKEEDDEQFEINLNNWGIVVRFSDINAHEWGDPAVFEFRINGADIDQEYELEPSDKQLGIHAPEQKGHDIVDLSSRDETRRQEAVTIMQQVIDKVRNDIKPYFETNKPPIVIHPGGITEHDMALEAIPKMNDALERSMDELDDQGVQLLLENMPPLPWIYGGQQYHNNFMDADEIAKYCERTGQKICYDTSHAKLYCNYADVDLYEHAKTLQPYTEYLHVADAIGVDGEGIQIGEGEIDFEQLMELYEDFEGPIITEIWRGHERKGRGFKKAAETLSGYL
jgi:N-acetylneuraminate synthase